MSESASSGVGGLAALGSIGGLLGGIGGLLGTGIQAYQAYRAQKEQAKMGRKQWMAVKPKSEELYNMLVYAPWLEGKKYPYSKVSYEYAPTSGMRKLYANALSRSYGMPAGVARAFSTQAMSQLRGSPLQANMTPLQVAASLNVNPQATSQALLSAQQIDMLNQRSLAQSAQNLAEFGRWRAAKIGELIG